MNSIMIADTHAICREALCEFIRNAASHMSVEGVADLTALGRRLEAGNVDLVLIDEHLYRKQPADYGGTVKLCLIAGKESESYPEHLSGVFYRSMSCKMMLSGIERVLSGQRFFPVPDDFTGRMVQEKAQGGKRPADYLLTAREQEVLSYLVRGASNKEIARALDLQVVTVKLHVRGICRKLQAANRTQAALMAQENGWN